MCMIRRPVVFPGFLRKRNFTTNGGRKGTCAIVLNAGSSSVKYGVYAASKTSSTRDWHLQDAKLLGAGVVENIDGSKNQALTITHQQIGEHRLKYDLDPSVNGHRGAFAKIFEVLTDPKSGVVKNLDDIKLVGHRIIHGGKLSKAMIIDDKVRKAIQETIHLAPLHNPANLIGIDIAKEALPDAKHVAVFDTAFHQTMPPEAYTYGIPRELAQEKGIRKYGFHGISYKYILQEVARELCASESKLNLIICHLGNGSSMACIEKGRSVDTTMGMTPLEGLLMGTRCGDIDAGIILHLCNTLKWSTEDIEGVLNCESGLKGICGMSDMRQVHQSVLNGDEAASLAEKIFVERIRKYLGSYLVRLKGDVDAIVFTGGIGENSARIRELVCQDLHRFGIVLDRIKNQALSKSDREISSIHSFCKVFIIPANEQLMIALQSLSTISMDDKSVFSEIQHEGKGRSHDTGPEINQSDSSDGSEDPNFTGILLASQNEDSLTDPAVAEVGLMSIITERKAKVGYFRPIADNMKDRRIVLMQKVFDIRDGPDAMFGVTISEAKKLISEDKEDQMIQKIVARFLTYQEGHDFVLISGHDCNSSYTSLSTNLPPRLNTKISAALNVPIAWATNTAAIRLPGETDEALTQRILKTAIFVKPKGEMQHAKLEGIMLTDVPSVVLQERTLEKISDALQQQNIKLIATIPSHQKLHIRTVADIADSLGAEILFSYSATSLESTHVNDIIIATPAVDQLLNTIFSRSENIERIGSVTVSPSLEASLRDEFAKFVFEKNGRIDATDISKVLAAVGYHPSERWLRAAMHELEHSGKETASLDFETLFQLITHRKEGEISDHSGPLIIASAARPDVLMSLLLAANSSNFPVIAGILLTGAADKSDLPPRVLEILRGLDVVGLPVLCVQLDTFTSVWRLLGPHGLHPPRLGAECSMKLQLVSDLYAKSSCQNFVREMFKERDRSPEMTSYIFKHHIRAKARGNKQRIVLPEGNDWRVLCAAAELIQQDACYVILLGNPKDVLAIAQKHRINLEGASIIDPLEALDLKDMARMMTVVRQSKGMTEGLAMSLLRRDFTWYGTMMMHAEKADGMVSGACHTTAETMRPAFQIIKTEPGISLASSIFFMLLRDRVYIFGDCAINVNPTAEDLAHIALASAKSAETFGIHPRVAMISYATGSSNTGPSIDKVRRATEILKSMKADLLVEGPIQFDAAVEPNVAKIKGVRGLVGGRANVCVFPDLNTGNTTYKAVQQATKCLAIGPIMQGLKKPVNDLSRGCTVKDIVNTVFITCLQAQACKR